MTPQQYLENRLKRCAHYELSLLDQESLKNIGVKDFIFWQITRKKFRRWKLPELARERINRVLDYCFSKQKPILFRFRFGGYKLWRLESAPEVDWAEFFTLVHYSEYLAPIIAVHKPGVKFLFISNDVFVERLNNIAREDTEAYFESFLKLRDQFRRFAPENFSVEVIRSRSLYSSDEELDKEFKAKIKEIEGPWKEKQNEERLKRSLEKAMLNIKWDGIRDLRNLSNEERQKVIEQSALMHDALVQLPTINTFFENNPSMIFVSATRYPNVVSIGTTKTSIVKFWVGTGVLEERSGKYLEHVLSPLQVEKLKGSFSQRIQIDLIPLKNFSAVEVYNQKLDFARNHV